MLLNLGDLLDSRKYEEWLQERKTHDDWLHDVSTMIESDREAVTH